MAAPSGDRGDGVTDPQAVLEARVRAALVAAFGLDEADADPVVRPSAFADFQANAALALGRRLGRPPRQVAATLVEHLQLADLCERVEVSGPGFVNLTLRGDWLGAQAAAMLADPRAGVAPAEPTERVVVDYSAPNVAKEMHVGHLRTTIVGDALVRVLGALGHEVIRRNHLGDWGTPFGMLIEHLLDVGEDATTDQLSVGELNDFYQQARAKFDHDPAFAGRARRRVVALQAGDEATLRLWRLLVRASTRYFRQVYGRLGVLLGDQDVHGESAYNHLLDQTAGELERRGIATTSQGALCLFPPGFTGRDGQPVPLIVRKQDGGYGYAATDLAAIRQRVRDLGARRLVYVVGVPQALHLEMVFAAARQAGWLDGVRAEHATIGSVLDEHGKILRTRSGSPIKLIELLDEGVERAAKLLADRVELDGRERARVARSVGIGAIKYADLSVARDRDYVFDWDRMLAFDGNTGPYLQYAVVRVRSIFRRAGLDPGDLHGGPIRVEAPAERALALHLLGFARVVHQVADTLEPHRLCGYLHDLAAAFTSFYEHYPVLDAPDDQTRRSRLGLSALTERVLTTGLGLLGIDAPARM
jgi:arginyl-tRNA synthetase